MLEVKEKWERKWHRDFIVLKGSEKGFKKGMRLREEDAARLFKNYYIITKNTETGVIDTWKGWQKKMEEDCTYKVKAFCRDLNEVCKYQEGRA